MCFANQTLGLPFVMNPLDRLGIYFAAWRGWLGNWKTRLETQRILYGMHSAPHSSLQNMFNFLVPVLQFMDRFGGVAVHQCTIMHVTAVCSALEVLHSMIRVAAINTSHTTEHQARQLMQATVLADPQQHWKTSMLILIPRLFSPTFNTNKFWIKQRRVFVSVDSVVSFCCRSSVVCGRGRGQKFRFSKEHESSLLHWTNRNLLRPTGRPNQQPETQADMQGSRPTNRQINTNYRCTEAADSKRQTDLWNNEGGMTKNMKGCRKPKKEQSARTSIIGKKGANKETQASKQASKQSGSMQTRKKRTSKNKSTQTEANSHTKKKNQWTKQRKLESTPKCRGLRKQFWARKRVQGS